MGNLFDTPDMAAGYARCRPPIHPLVLERARHWLPQPLPVEQALDVGCGAGLSTRALLALAHHCLGLDPSPAMVGCAALLVPQARFLVGRAEALPCPAGSIQLMTAAGSLNYVELPRFFAEARRVLAPDGVLLVYDFFQGSAFADGPGLQEWFEQFLLRYAMPQDSSQELNPALLNSYPSGLRPCGQESFEVGLELDAQSYLDYVMTETNVAHALQQGARETQIRAWCAQGLERLFAGQSREVRFGAYLACLHR